ncbi:hypothetical protein ACFPRL_10300 [Pseudoclavibacter helvolus]
MSAVMGVSALAGSIGSDGACLRLRSLAGLSCLVGRLGSDLPREDRPA